MEHNRHSDLWNFFASVSTEKDGSITELSPIEDNAMDLMSSQYVETNSFLRTDNFQQIVAETLNPKKAKPKTAIQQLEDKSLV